MENKTIITVFTPTYNRAYIIGKLYESLCVQTSYCFEWLVVDDGSDDNTEGLIRSFINEEKILIRYIRQPNGGKHRAINHGVGIARGELFFIVDSDDQLAQNAIEKIIFYYNQIKLDKSFAGVSGLRVNYEGKRIGGECDFGILDCSSVDFRLKYNFKGDMAEVFKIDVLKEFKFPEIEGEYFCPEALVFNRIARKYKLRYFYDKIYLCDYLIDGLTARIVQLRMNNPEASLIHYAELYRMSIPFHSKIKSSINFWRFAYCSKQSFLKKLSLIGIVSILVLPLGYLMHIKDLHS